MKLALKVFGGNVIELQILLACAEQPKSAKELSPSKDEIASVSYHFKALARDGLLRLAREERRRGAIARFYTATPKARRLLVKLGLPEDARP